MFGFPIVALPLTYLTLCAWFFPRSEGGELARYFGWGLLFALPGLLVHSILYRVFPALPGSFLFIFRIWWEYFSLPFGLATVTYRLLHSFQETGRSSVRLRQYAAFLFGFLSLFCVVFALRSTGFPNIFSLVFYPILAVAGIPVAAYLMERASNETGVYAVLWIAIAVAVSLIFACVAYFFEARLEWLGSILSLATLGIGSYLGYSTLK
jgi:hypothetical protein